jgi:hypothetical protein
MTDLTRTAPPGGIVDMNDYIARLQSGIAESRASTVIAGGGKPLLRLLKSGEWVFGPSNEEVQEGSHWAVNVLSLSHGWSCWVEGEGNNKNELKGEVLVPMIDPKPPRPAPIQDTPFNEVRAFEMKCVDGDDEGTEVATKINSIGGMRAVDALLASIYRQLSDDPLHPCPVVTLDKDSYQHTKWGQIYTPVFEIANWCDLNGELAPEAIENGARGKPQAAPQPAAAAPAPPKETAKPKKAALATSSKKAEPAPTAANRTGQRRRPGR